MRWMGQVVQVGMEASGISDVDFAPWPGYPGASSTKLTPVRHGAY